MNQKHPYLILTAFIVLSFATSVLGGTIVYANLQPWYEELERGPLSPPNWVFSVVWTVLYILLPVGTWLGWRLAEGATRRGLIIAFLINLALQLAWTAAFFGAHSPLFGLAFMLAIFVSTLNLYHRLWKLTRRGAELILPQILWLIYAASLNVSVWALNSF